MEIAERFRREVEDLERDWDSNPRWNGVTRDYTAEQVVRLRGTLMIEYTLAKYGAAKLWKLLETEDYVNSLGAMTGNQAVQMVKAGLKAIYLSGWQVAGQQPRHVTYPDRACTRPTVPRPWCGESTTCRRRVDQSNGRRAAMTTICRPHRGRRRGRIRRGVECIRDDQVPSSKQGPPACTSKTNWLPKRNVGTWAARCWCQPASTCAP